MSPIVMAWLLLAAGNLAVQIAYFVEDRHSGLRKAKKITTPALLFLGLLVVIDRTGGFPPVPGLILAAMGFGEIGMEGSTVVESRRMGNGDDAKAAGIPLSVTAAGALFLAVNVFIGVVLLVENAGKLGVTAGVPASLLLIAAAVFAVILYFKPSRETRIQIILYAAGLAVLFTGAFSDVLGGVTNETGMTILGKAAVVLTVSDFLVLFRMASGYDKKTTAGYRKLFVLLVVILSLYYLFIGMVIRLGISAG
jgi:hypothetical protein